MRKRVWRFAGEILTSALVRMTEWRVLIPTISATRFAYLPTPGVQRS